MGSYDVLMLLVVLFAAFLGWQKGMAWQIASIAAIVGSYFFAMQFRDQVAMYINLAAPMNTFAAMLVLYLGSSVIIWMIFRIVRRSIDQMKLRDFDRQMGALVGAAKGCLIACLITLFAVTLLPEQQMQVVIGSRSGNFIARFLNQAQAIMPTEVQHVLGPYLEKLDQPVAGDQFPSGNPFDPADGGTYSSPQFGQQPGGYQPSEYGQTNSTEYGPDPYYVPPTADTDDWRANNSDSDNWR
jgi:membrane protein required for colicin V production